MGRIDAVPAETRGGLARVDTSRTDAGPAGTGSAVTGPAVTGHVATGHVATGHVATGHVATGRAEHPICGDVVEVDVRIDAGRILDLRWRANGCPATHAVAACAHGALPGSEVAAAAMTLRRALATLGDLAAAERHAEALFGRAFTAAVAAAAGGH